MKKIFLILFMLYSFVFADKILKANLGGSCETKIRVNNGYIVCHSVDVKWNLTKGRITTYGNIDDENEKFMLRIWDKNDQRISDVVNVQVNKALADEKYKVYNENLEDAVNLEIVPLNENFSPYKLEIRCNNNSVKPYHFKNNDYQFYCNSTPYKNCPAGFHIADIKFDIDEYFDSYTCEKNKICSKRERYDVINNECVSPDSGYVWLNNDKNDLSQRPACKAENERYNENTNQCEYKIDNSHWIGKSLEYECNDGYFMANGGLCQEKVSCKEDERYDEENNSCISKPRNSHWNQDNDIIWTCDSGYVKRNESCEVKRVCNENQKYIESTNWCANPPANGSWNYSGDVVCNEGYVKVGLLCEQKANCEHWNSEDNTCFEKPTHSHWVYSDGANWECDNGYHSDTENEYCFKCEGETQFNYSTNTCVTKPENSHWSGEGIWHCNEGFFETEYSCEEIKECGFFERYNSYTNECVDKPSDSHWAADNSTNWVCDDGYYKTYNDKCEKTNPIDLSNYISIAHDLSFGFGAGFGKDQKDNSTPIVNVEAYYNIGAKIGNEFFNVRTQFSVGLLYTEFSYNNGYSYMDGTVNSMAFTYGPNFGFDFWLFSLDYSYIWRYGERLESITFNEAYSRYKFGINLNEHLNGNVTIISNMISSTSVLNEFNDNMFSIGLTYRF